MSGIRVFSKNANVVFIEKSEFFFYKAPVCYKIFSFQENLHFDDLKRVFPAFCTICMTNALGGQNLGNARNFNRAKFICDSYSTLQMYDAIIVCN